MLCPQLGALQGDDRCAGWGGGQQPAPQEWTACSGALGPGLSATACTEPPLALLNDCVSVATCWACP